tara:strand:+ start:724 stop:1518 length:795 start_codon:yes stop_codon:yes gene_type:complete
MKLISLMTADILRDCLSDIVKTKFEVDSNNFGGVMLERDLAKALRDNGHYVYTQRQIETLIDSGVEFVFPGNVSYEQFKRNQKDIDSDVYASDLFLFMNYDDTLVMEDSLSLKTSINDNDGSKVFLANDAEGVVYDRLTSGETLFDVGQVMIVSLNTKNLQFSVDYFDGEICDIVGLFHDSVVTTSKVTYNLKESVMGGKSRDVVSVINRNAVTGKKQTSFNRGVQIRRDFIPTLSSIGVFDSVCRGVVAVDLSELTEELLAVA